MFSREKTLRFMDRLIAKAVIKRDEARAEKEKYEFGTLDYILADNHEALQMGYIMGLEHGKQAIIDMD